MTHLDYRQISNIGRTFVSNRIVDHSEVAGSSSVGAGPSSPSFSAKHMALSSGHWCVLY